MKSWLAQQEEKGRLRRLVPISDRDGSRILLAGSPGQALVDFSSNDYLALAQHPTLIAAAQRALAEYGTSAGAARLMSGDLSIHHELEEAVALFKGKEAALSFGSGYMANAGIIPALVGRHDVIFSDRLNHASIHDGCRLAGARLVRFRHNDISHLESMLREKRGTGSALVVVESVYSMDGDCCPLSDLVALKKRHDFLLMVDEAHATGVFGRNGGGMIEEKEVGSGVDLAMGTFGKALGSYGAYVAASREMIDFLLNRARSFIFSTALPAPVAAASLAAVRLVQDDSGLRDELHGKMRYFKKCLRESGLGKDFGPSQIVPILVGEGVAALEAAALLREKGFFVTAVRPPTVPEGTSRLRFSVTLHQSETQLKDAVAALADVLNC